MRKPRRPAPRAEDSDTVWNRIGLRGRSERLSLLAEHNDSERRKAIPGVVKILRHWAADARFDARRNDALEEFADALSAVSMLDSSTEEANEPLIRRYDKAMMRLIALGLDTFLELARFCSGWTASRKRAGDKEALRWARRGLETGVRRGHTEEDMRVVRAISGAIPSRRDAQGEIVWGKVQSDVEAATGRPFGSLENFTKWVVLHLDDLLEELPPRADKKAT